mmetsp:Transcript_3912/g.9803  ORF Transcript_3912/g.9803 Transcript_3912/m.9803 type:complete len:126 (-) Transcript_3912:357-734(-)
MHGGDTYGGGESFGTKEQQVDRDSAAIAGVVRTHTFHTLLATALVFVVLLGVVAVLVNFTDKAPVRERLNAGGGAVMPTRDHGLPDKPPGCHADVDCPPDTRCHAKGVCVPRSNRFPTTAAPKEE